MTPKLAGVLRVQAPHEAEGNLAEAIGLRFISCLHRFKLTNMHMHDKARN